MNPLPLPRAIENPDPPTAHRLGAPYLIEHEGLRSLHFNRAEIQSVMWVDRPDDLYLEYTRLMMGCLMFVPQPRSLAMVGLGGGSLAKFCHRHLPEARILAWEIDPEVIALREDFCLPPDDRRWSVIAADGAKAIAAAEPAAFDVLMVDGYGGDGVPPALCSQAFYDACARSLDDSGVLVSNLHEAADEFDLQLTRIQRSFAASVTVHEGERGNCIVFAGGQAFATAMRQAAVRRPKDLDRAAWTQLKPAFARLLGNIRRAHTGALQAQWNIPD